MVLNMFKLIIVAGFSLSNYIKILVQQEACDWTGTREVARRIAGTETDSEERGEAKMEVYGQEADLILSGFK